MERKSRRIAGVSLCVAAVGLGVAGWTLARSAAVSTDDAYVRGDVTSLAPKVAGYVISLAVVDNEAVSAGDVLFRIDDRDYRARLAQADANLDAARARVANVDADTALQRALVQQVEAQRQAAVAEFDLAVRANERRRELIGRGATSQAQVDESNAARARAEAGVAAATASVEAQRRRIEVAVTQRDAAVAAVEQATAARELAQIDLDNTVVRAPIDGVVGNRQVRIGRLVAPGTSLLDLVPVGEVWIVANFKETQVGRIARGQSVDVTVDGYPDTVLAGVVDSFAPGSGSVFSLLPADNATGNFVRVVQRIPVKIRLRDRPALEHLVPGLSARVVVKPEGSS
jgi:membrane fusion protein, multidrug efflux system